MKYAIGILLIVGSVSAYAQKTEQVWRYVDDKSGQIVYSNVQIKGKKGDKIEILSYPPVKSESSGSSFNISIPAPLSAPNVLAPRQLAEASPAPIPEALLRQLQLNPSLPAGLPPLPASERTAGAVPTPKPNLVPALPAGGQPASSSVSVKTNEPRWAKSVETTGTQPGWAKDPFKQAD